MKRNTLIWIVVILLATNIASFVGFFLAKHRSHDFTRGCQGTDVRQSDKHFMHRLKKDLQLSDEQWQHIVVLHKDFRQQLHALREQMNTNQKALLQALQHSPSDSVVEHYAQAYGMLHKQMKLSMSHFLMAMQQQLDSTQQRAMFEHFGDMHQRHCARTKQCANKHRKK